jgi:hypothetical protein
MNDELGIRNYLQNLIAGLSILLKPNTQLIPSSEDKTKAINFYNQGKTPLHNNLKYNHLN